MFKQESASEYVTGRRFVWGWMSAFVLLLLFGVLSGCGTSVGTPATTSTTPLSHPPTAVGTGPFHTVAQTFDKDFTITLDITPNRAGSNQFVVQIMDNRANKPAAHVTVMIYTTMQDMAMGTDSILLHASAGGQFSATSDVLSMGGDWALGITIQTPDHVIHKAGVSFVMPS